MNNYLEAVALCKKLRYSANREGKGGTSYPGEKALEKCPSALQIVAQNTSVVLVTGSSGKTTTVRMIGTILRKQGIPFASNREGANMTAGITEAFLLKTDDSGVLRERIAVMECDEMYIPKMIKQLHVICVIVTNITTDQPYRHPDFRQVAKVIAQSLAACPAVVCCLNGKDEGCRLIAESVANEIVRFDEEDAGIIVDGNKIRVELRFLPNDIYQADAAAALSCVKVINSKLGTGISMQEAVSAVCETKPAYGRGSSIRIGNSSLIMENFKNPESMQRIFLWLEREGQKPNLIFASANERELTWMQTYDWQPMKDIAETIYVYGETEEAGFLCDQLQSVRLESLDEMERILLNTAQKAVLLCEYWALLKIWEYFAQKGYTEHFWNN